MTWLMSELHWPVRLMLAGSTGLVGRTLMERISGEKDFELVALSRREVKLPSRTQMRVSSSLGAGQALVWEAPREASSAG